MQSQAEFNKRIASVKFETVRSAYGKYYEVQSYPYHTDSFCADTNKIKAEAVCKFLNDMPLHDLAAYLSARDVRWKNWLEHGEFAFNHSAA